MGPRLVAAKVGIPHATVHRALRRRGCSRRPRRPRDEVCRSEWPCPGDLLHIDTKRFQRFTRPGWAVTANHRRSGAEKRMRIGHEFVHSIIDDHTRLAYSELHPDERASVTGFVGRALALYATHGIEPQRLLSAPQANGKVERYQQTLKREWALGRGRDRRAAASRDPSRKGVGARGAPRAGGWVPFRQAAWR